MPPSESKQAITLPLKIHETVVSLRNYRESEEVGIDEESNTLLDGNRGRGMGELAVNLGSPTRSANEVFTDLD